MKTLSKLFVIVISLVFLTACNFFGGDQTTSEISNTMPAEGSTVDETVVVDDEVEILIEDEAAVDAELDSLETEEL